VSVPNSPASAMFPELRHGLRFRYDSHLRLGRRVIMRRIEVVEGLRVGFPGRDETFLEGFEMGLLAAAFASGAPEISMRLAPSSVDQARDLGRALGYVPVGQQATDVSGWVEMCFRARAATPRLRLVR
jgi:hypothetical protein